METGDIDAGRVEEMLRRGGIDLTTSHRLELGPWWSHDLYSPFWRLYAHNRSGAWIVHAQRRIPLQPGRLYVIPAWVRFQTAAPRPVMQDFLHFHVTGFPPSLLRRVFDRPLLLPAEPVLGGLLRRWRAGLGRPADFATLGWARALAHAAVAASIEMLPEAGRETCFRSLAGAGELGPALEFIDRNLSRPPSNAELARLCHWSSDTFIRRFRSVVGMTPAQYGLERRVALAAQWLTATPRSIDDIAEASGFTDRFHFSRVFKTRLGLPPAAYRRLHRLALGTSTRRR